MALNVSNMVLVECIGFLNRNLLHPAVLRAAVVVEHRAEAIVPAVDHPPADLPEQAGRAGGGADSIKIHLNYTDVLGLPCPHGPSGARFLSNIRDLPRR